MANKKWTWTSHVYSQWTVSKSDNKEIARVKILRRIKWGGEI